MDKIEKIRGARQDRFYEQRMSRAKSQQAAADRKQLEQEIHLVKAPGALAKEKEEKLKGEAAAGGAVGADGRVLWMPG